MSVLLAAIAWIVVSAVVSLVASQAILRTWPDRVGVLVANAIVGAGTLAAMSSLGALMGVSQGDDPVMLASMWIIMPAIVVTYLVLWGVSVTLSHPAPGVARKVYVGLAAGIVPSLAGPVTVVMFVLMLTGMQG